MQTSSKKEKFMDKKYGLEEIRAEAVESILEFGGKRLSVHLPYADEPTDPVTLRGYPVVMDSTPTEMTECLGYACPAKSDTCTICPLATATEKKKILFLVSCSSEDPCRLLIKCFKAGTMLCTPCTKGHPQAVAVVHLLRLSFSSE